MNVLRSARRTAAAGLAALTLSGAAFMAPAATAQPAPAPLSSAPFGSSSPVDHLGRPTPEFAAQVNALADSPLIPPHIASMIKSALAFTTGNNDMEGVALPTNGPHFIQYVWPTVSRHCIDGQLDAVGTAIAVPGPAEIPAPGVGPQDTGFVFTALGTAPAAEKQGRMHAHWINLDTLKWGSTPLENHGLNPDGPATITGVAPTGKGTVLSVIGGDVLTKNSTCSFAPTFAIIEAR